MKLKRRSSQLLAGVTKKKKSSHTFSALTKVESSSKSASEQRKEVKYLKPKVVQSSGKGFKFRRLTKPPFRSSRNESIFNEFTKIEEIGKGSYGVVVKMKRKNEPNKLWAVKKLRYRVSKSAKQIYTEISPDVYRELAVSSSRGLQLRKRYIVPLEEVIFGKHECWFIYPCYRMDLRHLILRYKKRVPSDIIRTVFHHCVQAVHALHDAGFVHRDIKPSNYLIEYSEKNPGKILLADFGLSRDLTVPEVNLKKDGEVVTLWYRPLDLLLGNKDYDYLVDIWSLGCVLGELFLGSPVFKGKPNGRNNRRSRHHHLEDDQVRKILDVCGFPSCKCLEYFSHLDHYQTLIQDDWRQIPNKLKEKFDGMQEHCFDLLKHLLCYHPLRRYSSSRTLRHTYFDDVSQFIWEESRPDFIY